MAEFMGVRADPAGVPVKTTLTKLTAQVPLAAATKSARPRRSTRSTDG